MVRRVWRYPLAWASLSDDALLHLMDDMLMDDMVSYRRSTLSI
jgi:hypothetical protein